MIRAVMAMCIMASPIHAQSWECADRALIVAALKADFGEVHVMLGRQGPTVILELLSNPDTGTWTMLTTGDNGVSCLLAAGTDLVALMSGDPA